MSRYLLVPLFLLLLVAGCRHANLPAPSASHGHLSRAVTQHLAEEARPPEYYWPGEGTPEVEVAPAEAPSVFAEAVRVLKGTPQEAEVLQALEDVRAACEAGLREACDFKQRELTAPKALEYQRSSLAHQGQVPRLHAVIILRCRIPVDGRLRECGVMEASAPESLVQAHLQALQEAKFQPLTFAGHPVGSTYTFVHDYKGGELSDERRLEWARQRTQRFPRSSLAWLHLAEMLAKLAPESPEYAVALQRMNREAPRHWWAASELAWLHARAGRYTEALPLSRTARKVAPLHPYVLETSAAVMAGTGPCAEAVAEQTRALEALPSRWLEEERERFSRALGDYRQRCQGGGSPAVPGPAAGTR